MKKIASAAITALTLTLVLTGCSPATEAEPAEKAVSETTPAPEATETTSLDDIPIDNKCPEGFNPDFEPSDFLHGTGVTPEPGSVLAETCFMVNNEYDTWNAYAGGGTAKSRAMVDELIDLGWTVDTAWVPKYAGQEQTVLRHATAPPLLVGGERTFEELPEGALEEMAESSGQSFDGWTTGYHGEMVGLAELGEGPGMVSLFVTTG